MKRLIDFPLAAAFLLFASTALSAPIGVAVDASTVVTGAGPAGVRTISKDSPVFRDDRLSADRTGNAQIILVDKTKIVVGPNAKVDIDDFVFASDDSFKSITIKATAGAFRFISGKSGSSAYKIDTPVGSIGVRGTAFDVAIADGQAHVTLVRGAVEMCPDNGECKLMRGWCSYSVMTDREVDTRGKLPARPKADRDLFPLMVNQRPLKTGFRHWGPSCAGNYAFITPSSPDRTERAERASISPDPVTTGGTPEPEAPSEGPSEGPTGDSGGSSNHSGHGDGSNPGNGASNNGQNNNGSENPGGGNG